VYVLIQKYGIEGLLVEDSPSSLANQGGKTLCTKIAADVQKEEAQLQVTTPDAKSETVRIILFDHLLIQIQAEMIEFRRSINLHFRGCLNINTMKGSGKSDKASTEQIGHGVQGDE